MPYIKKLYLQGFKSFAKPTNVIFDKGMNVIVGPNGSGKSTRWDTEVILNSGEIKPIGEIVDGALKKAKIKINMNDGVYTKENPESLKTWGLDPENLKITEKKISAFIKRKGEPFLYEITTNTGRTVTTTGCHPVMGYKDRKVQSEIVEKLKQGQFIALPNKLIFPEIDTKLELPKDIPHKIMGNKIILKDSKRSVIINQKLNIEFARFLGYLLGDGCIIKNSRCDFVNNNKELLEDFEMITQKFGAKIGKSIGKKRANTIYVYSKYLANYLIQLFKENYKKEKKHIPSFILFSKKEILAATLATLFDCDSSIRKDNPSFEYVTMSEKLANDVLIALIRFEIVARKKTKMKYATNSVNKIKRKYFHIVIEGKQKLQKLYENIPLRCKHKKNLLKKWAQKEIRPNSNIDLIPLEVNKLIKECIQMLRIQVKPLKKIYPKLKAYNENICCPTRQGLEECLEVFQNKLKMFKKAKANLKLDQKFLTETIKKLKFQKSDIAYFVGVRRTTITDRWEKAISRAKPTNLEKFFCFVKKEVDERIKKAEGIIFLLKSLSNSDIFWDKIVSIKKVGGEPWVYDLSIPNCHNFIGNGIFVHNSNLADAVCFVLGRLRVKSLRANKAAKLIYHGGKEGKPAQSAKVSMVFDNRDGIFALPVPSTEVEISRIVKKDGTSVYKINGQTKTRQEVLELLAQAGIDPDGFNIILQAEINGIIQMHSEEKREIIEEIAGIGVYETRKEKSLRELEKTESKLKEVRTILNERAAYMRNLEKEKAQAEKYEKLRRVIRLNKAALMFKRVREKENDSKNLLNKIKSKKEQLSKIQDKSGSIQKRITDLDRQIQDINGYIEKRSGVEQEYLYHQISELRSEIAIISVKIENYKEQSNTIDKRIEQLKIDGVRTGQELKQLEQEKSRQKEYKLNAQEFKVEILKAASKIKEESKKLENIFSELFEKIRQRKTRIDDLIRQNKIKEIHEEVNALVYFLEENIPELKKISEENDRIANEISKLKIEEEKRNINLEIELAKKELDRIKDIVKKSIQEKKDMEQFIEELKREHEKKKKVVVEKEKIEKKLRSNFDRLLLKKSQLNGIIKKQEIMSKVEESKAREIENEINTLNILKAKIDAELEVVKDEMQEYRDLREELEKVSGSRIEIEVRISRNEKELNEIGYVNLKALEVYDRIKNEYEEIELKVNKLEEEKEEILKIIEEVDKKKKQAFMQAFNVINNSFSENFMALSNKGKAFLELENKQDPFKEGMNIIIKLAKGKYMDADQLSGGEKVIVALALIFAIQKYKPYCFYIFDEIDPALDKRNSERLASILRKSIQKSQCIIITHNDAVIDQADVLYGITMQKGVSKVIGLKV